MFRRETEEDAENVDFEEEEITEQPVAKGRGKRKRGQMKQDQEVDPGGMVCLQCVCPDE